MTPASINGFFLQTVCKSCKIQLRRQHPRAIVRSLATTRQPPDPLAKPAPKFDLNFPLRKFEPAKTDADSLRGQNAVVGRLQNLLARETTSTPYSPASRPPSTPHIHRMHVYAHKHNTHITLTRPNPDDPARPKAIISVSAGNLGFKKAARSSFDAAYQLSAYVLGRIQGEGLLTEIRELEIVFRGFGIGREAVTKSIMGNEGRMIRGLIKAVKDSTRLKFGGTRSKKPRRLG